MMKLRGDFTDMRPAWLAAMAGAMILALNVAEARAQGAGFVVGGFGGHSGFFGSAVNALRIAGGGEVLAGGRLGIGGDAGFFSRLVTVSVTGSWHVNGVGPSERPRPFVTGGYGVMGVGDGEGSFSAWVVGGGADFGSRERVAFRIEFRDNVRPDTRGAVQYWSVSFGVMFR